jgi:O-antigen/teichoic acid export membrane protein
MQKTFLSNLSLLMVLNLLIKPAYLLFVEAEVQNRVGSEVFGHYSALLSLGFLLNIVLDLGINTFTSRELSRRNDVVSNYFSGVVLLRLLLAGVYFIVLTGLAFVLGYSQTSIVLLVWIGVNQLLAATVLYIRSNLSGLLLFRQDAVLSVLDRAVAFGLLVVVLYGGMAREAFDIRYLIGAQTVAYGAGILVGMLFLAPHIGEWKPRWKPRLNRVVLNQSIPYALLVMLMMVYYKTDSVMLERMRPDGAWQAGVYAMGYRLFEAANMLGYLFATLLLPLFSRMLKSGANVRPLVDNAFRIVITGSLALAVACSFWSTDIIGTVYDHDIEAASSLFKLLMWAFVFMMTSYVWGTLLTAHGNMRGMNTVAAVAVVLNIALNAWLIPEHGAFGSAAASLATQILVAFTQMILVSRSTGTAPQAPTLMRSALYLGVLLAAAFGMKHLAWGVAVELVLFGAIAAVSALSLGLIKRVQFSQLLRTNEGAGE